MKIFLLIYLFILCSKLLANSDLIVIAGNANQIRYANISKLWYNSFKLEGNRLIYANPTSYELLNKWRFVDSADFVLFNNKNQLGDFPSKNTKQGQSFYNELISKTKEFPKDPLVIFINDHGYASNGLERDEDGSFSSDIPIVMNPLDSGIDMGEANLSHRELSEYISKTHSSRKYVRLIGVHCFSGGLHSISFKNPNTCSASSSDWLTVSHSTPVINLYANAFVNEKDLLPNEKQFDFDKNGKTSLMEGHLAGLSYDPVNFGRGQISSFAYVDSVLKKGAYDPSLQDDDYDPRTNILQSIICKKNKTEVLNDPLTRFVQWGFSLFDHKYVRTIDRTQQILQVESYELSDSELKLLPDKLQMFYKQLQESPILQSNIKELEEHGSFYLNEMLDKINQRDELISQKEEMKIPRVYKGLINSRFSFSVRISKLNKEIRELKKKLAYFQGKVMGIYNYFQGLKRTSEFLETALPEQKKKYYDLLECEMADL